MPAVCFSFEVHQPYRLKPYGVFDVGNDHEYFDDALNESIFRKVATNCYLPTNEVLLRLIERHEGRFRVSFSITGVAIEQMKRWAPEALQSFRRLVATGCVELLAETYHHSLASLYDSVEFKAQVEAHVALMETELGQRPRVFRNTELIYNDSIGALAAEMGFSGILAEGADDVLEGRSPNHVYTTAEGGIALLLKNYRLSDDIAFRFGDRSWPAHPLTASRFADWIHRASGSSDVVNLFMDYETFGEHQWARTGIFEFLEHLPGELLAHPEWSVLTPSEVIDAYPSVSELSFPRTVSWADEARDLSAWSGNEMQASALGAAYELAAEVKRRNNPALLETWRRLLTSDHFYYMCTKWFADGDVHAYFSPFESPYEAFIPYMSALRDLSEHVLAAPRPPRPNLANA